VKFPVDDSNIIACVKGLLGNLPVLTFRKRCCEFAETGYVR